MYKDFDGSGSTIPGFTGGISSVIQKASREKTPTDCRCVYKNAVSVSIVKTAVSRQRTELLWVGDRSGRLQFNDKVFFF